MKAVPTQIHILPVSPVPERPDFLEPYRILPPHQPG